MTDNDTDISISTIYITMPQSVQTGCFQYTLSSTLHDLLAANFVVEVRKI